MSKLLILLLVPAVVLSIKVDSFYEGNPFFHSKALPYSLRLTIPVEPDIYPVIVF